MTEIEQPTEKDAAENVSYETSIPSDITPLGEVLAAARQAMDYSQADVSNYLRFSVAQINALENNDFSALPQPMITRGFIRNYARYVELDAAPLLASYKQRVPEMAPFAVRVKSDSYEVMDNKSNTPWLKYILASILILLFLVAWMVYVEFLPEAFVGDVNEALPTVVSDPAKIDEPEVAISPPLSNDLLDGASLNQPNTVTTLADELNNNAQVTSGNIVTQPLPLSSSPVVASTPTISASDLSQSIAQANIAVTAETWVQATDSSGKVVFEKLLPAGASEVFSGPKPFNLIIGNARATSIIYAGQALDLKPYTTDNNVARVRLE